MEAAAEKSRFATVLIFRHEPIIIYSSLPAGGTYYPIRMSSTNSEWLIGISDTFSAFCLRVSVIFLMYLQQKRTYSALHPQAWIRIYSSMPAGTYRVQSPEFPKLVYWRTCWSRLCMCHRSLSPPRQVTWLCTWMTWKSALRIRPPTLPEIFNHYRLPKYLHVRAQELRENRGGLSVLTSLTVSVDVKQYSTHWS